MPGTPLNFRFSIGVFRFYFIFYLFYFFVWENLASVSERYIFTNKTKCQIFLDIVSGRDFFAKLKCLSLWKVGWGKVGSGPTFYFYLFF